MPIPLILQNIGQMLVGSHQLTLHLLLKMHPGNRVQVRHVHVRETFMDKYFSFGNKVQGIPVGHFHKVLRVVLPRKKLLPCFAIPLDKCVQIEGDMLSKCHPVRMVVVYHLKIDAALISKHLKYLKRPTRLRSIVKQPRLLPYKPSPELLSSTKGQPANEMRNVVVDYFLAILPRFLRNKSMIDIVNAFDIQPIENCALINLLRQETSPFVSLATVTKKALIKKLNSL